VPESPLCELLRCDPLEQALSLPLAACLFPLGFPLEIATNSQPVLDAAARAWDSYPEIFSVQPLHLRVAVAADGSADVPRVPLCRGQQHLFVMISDADNFAVGDYTSQFAFCRLAPGALADPDFLRFHFLEGLVYSMLAQSYLTMIHAACVSAGGRGVLLCGQSGSGKSSLAFACASRGWDYVADDASALVRGDRTRTVLGRPLHIRFRPSAAGLFPELRRYPEGRNMNGKPTIEVATATVPGLKPAFQARADFLVFLNRHSSNAQGLFPISKLDALDRLLSDVPLYDPLMREQQEAPCRDLVEAGAFELRYQDLDTAVVLLEALVTSGS
jgi:hypothetical protein